MPHQHASIKHLRQTKKRTIANTTMKRKAEYLKKGILKKVAAKDAAGAQELLRQYAKAIDKAAKRNVVKKNTASRKKSRLSKKINALSAKV
ncbi:30S ribosomal protein S20 [Candidatus Uhrbacteria bacterium]|nr:30S ribosomal protein S20 [Candidatus Uhrbacteria bacterium]